MTHQGFKYAILNTYASDHTHYYKIITLGKFMSTKYVIELIKILINIYMNYI